MTDTCSKPGCAGGHIPGNCTGHASNGSGKPCGKRPMDGQQVCGSHGGRSPVALAKAAAVQAEQESQAKVLKAVAEWNPDLVPDDPGDLLLRVTHVTWMQAAAHRAQLAVNEGKGGNPFVRFDSNGREWPSALAVLEQTERRMLADMAAKAVGADLMGRHLRLMQRYGDSIADVAEAMVREFAPDLDPLDPEVRARVRRVLLSVAGEAA